MDKKIRRANAKLAAAEKYIYNLFYGDHKIYWSKKIGYGVTPNKQKEDQI